MSRVCNNRVKIVSRRNEIRGLLLKGLPRAEIKDYLFENYGLKPTGAYLDIRKVSKSLAEHCLVSRSTFVLDHLMKYELLYKELSALGFSRLSMRALRQKEKVAGVDGKREAGTINLSFMKTNIKLTGSSVFERKHLDKASRKKLSAYIKRAVFQR